MVGATLGEEEEEEEALCASKSLNAGINVASCTPPGPHCVALS